MNIRSTRRWSKTGNLELSCTFPVGHIRVCTEECAVGHFSVEKFPLRNTTKELRQGPPMSLNLDDHQMIKVLHVSWSNQHEDFQGLTNDHKGIRGCGIFARTLELGKAVFNFHAPTQSGWVLKALTLHLALAEFFIDPEKMDVLEAFRSQRSQSPFWGPTWYFIWRDSVAMLQHVQVAHTCKSRNPFSRHFFSKPYEVFNALLMCVLFPAMGLGFVSKDSRMVSLFLFPMFPVAWEHPQTRRLALHMLHRMPTTGKSDVFALKMLVGATLYVVPGMTIAGWLNYFQEGWSFQTTNRSTVQEL